MCQYKGIVVPAVQYLTRGCLLGKRCELDFIIGQDVFEGELPKIGHGECRGALRPGPDPGRSWSSREGATVSVLDEKSEGLRNRSSSLGISQSPGVGEMSKHVKQTTMLWSLVGKSEAGHFLVICQWNSSDYIQFEMEVEPPLPKAVSKLIYHRFLLGNIELHINKLQLY